MKGFRKTVSAVLAAAVTGLLVSGTAAHATTVTIKNASFESTYNPYNSDWASASDWVFSGPSQFESNAGSWNGLSAQAGSRKCNWSGQTVSQNLGVPAAANATYSLTFYVGRPNGQSQGTFRAELFDDAGSIIDSGTLNGPTTSPTWQKYTLTGVAGASGSGNLTVRFTSVNGGGNANWLDNVMGQ